MIRLEHVVLPSPEQMEFVIEGMRNPMNSWDRSDSKLDGIDPTFGCWSNCGTCDEYERCDFTQIGPNDLDLMQKLSKAGTDHRKFMRMMPVMVRITAPLYWWKEFDTYKVGTVANSCSTMHKIADKRFDISDFSNDNLMGTNTELLEKTIERLNIYRDLYLGYDGFKEQFGKYEKKEYWWQLIQLLPSSYNQTRNVMLNYEVLKNIYTSRKDHKLDEWVSFCKWIEGIPYSQLIVL